MALYGLMRQTALSLIMVMTCCGGAWAAATITGTIANHTGKTGWAYLSADDGLGTAVLFDAADDTAAKPFSIRGVRANTSVALKAFLDLGNDGTRNANDPEVTGGMNFIYYDGDVVAADPLVLTNAAPVYPGTQSDPAVLRGDGCNLLSWSGEVDGTDRVIADSYTVSWSSSDTGAPLLGAVTLPAGKEGFWVHHGGEAGHHYRVEALVGVQRVASNWTAVTPRPVGTTVSASFTLSGISPAGTLMAALVDESSEEFRLAPATASFGASPTVLQFTGVQPGSYRLFAFIDLNGNGVDDPGDVILPEDQAQLVQVGAAPVTGIAVALSPRDAAVRVRTTHSRNDKYEWYGVDFRVEPLGKRPVKAVVNPYYGIALPLDIGLREWGEFQHWRFLEGGRPPKGGGYSVQVTYSDGSTAELSAPVTGVLDSFPLPKSPVGPVIPGNLQPQFSWQAPADPPAGDYSYSIHLDTLNGTNPRWDVDGIPAGELSIPYGGLPLTAHIWYLYTIALQDAFGNRAEYQTTFMTASRAFITGFTPAAGTAGSTITIDGLNFGSTASVSIGGVQASVQSRSDTRLVATVPNLSSSGNKNVAVSTSQGSALNPVFFESFYYGAGPSFTGKAVQHGSYAPVSGAVLSLENFDSVKSSTGAEGTATLSGLPPERSIVLKLSKDGFIPVYSSLMTPGGTVDATANPFVLYTPADVAGWNMLPGKSILLVRVLDASGNPVSGASVSASGNYRSYTIDYSADGATFGGSSTGANGLAIVRNVDVGDWVSVTAAKGNLSFAGGTFATFYGAMTEGALFGSAAPAPVVSGLSPSSGTVGSSIAISGSGFSEVPGLNTVRFNGTAAQVVSAAPSQLVVAVPPGATSGPVSVETAAGSAASAQSFTVLHPVTVTTAGTGTGTVTSTPAGISCLSGSSSGCSASFDQGESVTLLHSAAAGSAFVGWSGDCAGPGACSVLANGSRNVSATFDTEHNVKVMGPTPALYGLLQQAYDAAQAGAEIRARSVEFSENLALSRDISVWIKGGYDTLFADDSGIRSVLIGSLKVRSGTLKVRNIAVR